MDVSPTKLQYIELLDEVITDEVAEENIFECKYKKGRVARLKRIRRKKGNKITIRYK